MNRVCSVIQLIAHFQNHTLINIETLRGDLKQNFNVFPGIYNF